MSGIRRTSRMLTLEGGLRSGVSDYGARPEHFVIAENVEFRPYRAARSRKGSQRSCSDTLAYQPHTLMEWVGSSTVSNKYGCCKDSPNGRLFRMSSGAFTPQTVPITLQPETWLVWTQLNACLFATENGGSSHPFFYRASNAAETWLDCVYPTPGATLTLTAAVTGGAAMAPNYYGYRLRHLFADGSSIASTVQTVQVVGPNNSVAVTTIPISPAGRTDYTGWVLERTVGYPTAAAASLGPYYKVAVGTANAYTDTFADADLGYQSDDNWYTGIPNGHLDGLIALPDRLAGWSGSTLYVSQPIADPSGAGILNFNGDNAYDFALDDGDRITNVWRQNDRLIVQKEHSTWAFEGNDPSNYAVAHLADVGAAGARAGASMGAAGWFYGAAGLHRIVGNDIAPFGYVEVGDVVERITNSSKVVVRNHLGQRVLIGFARDEAYNDTLLVHDLRFRTWQVWDGWFPADILVPKVADFGDNEAFLIADPRDFDPGVGTDYRIWTAHYGRKDERNSAGGTGSDIPIKLRTPWIDDGVPDIEKAFEWLQVYGGGAAVTITAIVETDPPSQTAVLQLTVPDTGKKWGTFVWGDGTKWGKPNTDSASEAGARVGLKGRRYRITFVASVPDTFLFNGYSMLEIIQPIRRYSK